mmetsp:Transcript_7372/g.22404  ORF Transcript_7372/g.22404 Transcript_7372/m.22404 type:complete len:89 (+) Transcript_7372:1528-1794(+)
MSLLQTAGFDPAFFLHHANVDRLLAIWQVRELGAQEDSESGRCVVVWTTPCLQVSQQIRGGAPTLAGSYPTPRKQGQQGLGRGTDERR